MPCSPRGVSQATALAQFGPAALPYGEQLATCLQRHDGDEASKAAVLAALGALGATQHSNVMVVPGMKGGWLGLG